MEKGDGYLAGSLTSGIQAEVSSQMWWRGEKVAFPFIPFKLTCTAPIITLLRVVPPGWDRPLGLQRVPGKACWPLVSYVHAHTCLAPGSGHRDGAQLRVSVVAHTVPQTKGPAAEGDSSESAFAG